jgi:hypothetical protein
MLSRRSLIVATAGLAGTAAALPAVAAGAVAVVYVGGWDCEPCATWKKRYKADWLASPLFGRVTWVEVEAPRLKEAYQERYWPDDLRPVLASLPRKSGTPRFLVVRDGRVVANEFGVSTWPRILDAVKKQTG